MSLLPAGFLDTRDETVAGHLTELDSAETECPHVALWTAGERTTVVQTYRRSVLRELVKSSPITSLFESLPFGGILGNQFRALYLAGLH